MAQFSGRFSGIFICYRRDDSAGHAGRLYDQFVRYFGDEHVFMDLDRIEPGEIFEEVIGEAVSSCETLIVLIGRDWLTIRDEKGRRLDNPKDFVRLEITAALERKVRVIPVLVQGATMPQPEDLPDEMSRFSRHHAFELSDRRWKQDVARLINSLERTLEVRRSIAPPYITAQLEAGPQRHEAEETRPQAEGDESDKLTVDMPLFVPAAQPVVLQGVGERTEVVPLFMPAAKPGVLQSAGEQEVVQSKAQTARIRKPSLRIMTVLALGAAGIVWVVLIILLVVENQNTNSAIASTVQAEETTPPIGQAGQNTAQGLTATPKTQTNMNLPSEVAPTTPAKTPTPQATPAAVSTAKPRREATPDERFYLGLAIVKERKKLSSLTLDKLKEALEHFKRAKGGTHATEAGEWMKKLKKELNLP